MEAVVEIVKGGKEFGLVIEEIAGSFEEIGKQAEK